MIVRSVISGFLAALVAGAAFAQAPPTAQDAWARATPPGAAAGAAYLTLTSPIDDTLTGVTSPVAAAAGVHENVMEGDVMRMREVAGGLALPAGKPVTLTPGGYHIMLEGLKTPLKQGDTLPLHLIFRTAPPLDVTATIRAIGAAAPMPGMTMPK